MMKNLLPIALLLALVSSSGCSRKSASDDALTLSSGVQLVELSDCSNATSVQPSLAIHNDTSAYLLKVADVLSCQPMEPPWVTVQGNKKATLVLPPKHTWRDSTCECARSATLRITDRLEAGDTLYVVQSNYVLGHVIVPPL
jgi:hypothetical protein